MHTNTHNTQHTLCASERKAKAIKWAGLGWELEQFLRSEGGQSKLCDHLSFKYFYFVFVVTPFGLSHESLGSVSLSMCIVVVSYLLCRSDRHSIVHHRGKLVLLLMLHPLHSGLQVERVLCLNPNKVYRSKLQKRLFVNLAAQNNTHTHY